MSSSRVMRLATPWRILKMTAILWWTVRPPQAHGLDAEKARVQSDLVLSGYRKLREWRERFLICAALFYFGFHHIGAARDRAMKRCRRLIRQFPDDPAMWLALGQRWLDQSAVEFEASDEPMHCFEEALRLKPNSAEAWYGAGMALQHRGQFAGAARAYHAVLDNDQSHVAARFRLWCMGKQGHVAPESSIQPYRAPAESFREITLQQAETASAEEIERLRALHGAGTVIIREAVPRERIARIRELIIPFVKQYDYAKANTIALADAPADLKGAIDLVIRDDILGRLLPLFSYWSNRGWEPILSPYQWIQYFPPQQDSKRPLGFGTGLHQDHPVHSQQSDFTTFWTALSKCGPGIASTLRILSTPLRHPIDSLDHHLKRINRVPDEWITEFFAGAMVTVSADAGDIVTFGRYMLHHTFFDPQMTEERFSFDFRCKTGPSRADLNTFK
jgi:hypothetical protein